MEAVLPWQAGPFPCLMYVPPSPGIISYDKNPCLKFELLGCEVQEEQPLLGFDMGYSMCVDAEPPQFVNCPSELLQVRLNWHSQLPRIPLNWLGSGADLFQCRTKCYG